MNRKGKIKGNGFKEIEDILHKVAIRLEKTAIGIAELKERQKKTDSEIDKLRESQKKTDSEIDKLRESQKKTDEQLKKTDEQIRETERLVNRTNRQIGELTDGWGKFVEGLVAPSVPRLFSQLGIKIYKTYPRALSRLNGRELEIDVLCIGKVKKKNIAIATEVKSALGLSDVKSYLKALDNFFKFFDEYRGYELIGAVSGIRVEKGAVEFAEKSGLYVLVPSGETMVIANKKTFRPRIWR